MNSTKDNTKQASTDIKSSHPVIAKLVAKAAEARQFAPVSQEYISAQTPMGATLVADGASFRVWAPNAAIELHVRLSDRPDIISAPGDEWQPGKESLLKRNADNTWTGFVAGVQEGDHYRFYLAGRGQPYKRDPYARELEFYGYPNCDCIVRDASRYPWHDQAWHTPPFNELVIYQLHIGRFHAVDTAGQDERLQRVGKFLDVLERLPYLAALGVNAIEPLPVVEFQGPYSLGYNGTDLFSPEMDYAVEADDLAPYLVTVNQLLTARGGAPLTPGQLIGQVNQLKAMIDICHLYGIAVILDVVYNHAGGFGDDDQSCYFFDRDFTGNNNDSQYFTDQGHAGGLVFAFWKDEVRQFLINNASFFLGEYHADGLRYDQVTVIDENGGWSFLQDLTDTLHYHHPASINIAEYWRDDPSWVLREVAQGGAGFDAVWYPGLRGSVRGAIAQAAQGRDASVNLDAVRDSLQCPQGFAVAWRAVQHLENHDRQRMENDNDREPRIPCLADATNPRSWYARSRSRVASGLLLTAPGIPMLLMGQEFLEDKFWSDAPRSDALIWWDGLISDRHMADHLHCTQDLIHLRRSLPALCGESINVFHVHEGNRVIAYHRWIEGVGQDVVIVASLNEESFDAYELGFPLPGRWNEVFNSDAYDFWPNPRAVGNGGRIEAQGGPLHGLPHGARIVLPANGLLVFVRE